MLPQRFPAAYAACSFYAPRPSALQLLRPEVMKALLPRVAGARDAVEARRAARPGGSFSGQRLEI